MDIVKIKEEYDVESVVLDIVKEEYCIQGEYMAESYPEEFTIEMSSGSSIIKTEDENVKEKKTFECPKCKLKFLRQLSLEQHICKLGQRIDYAFLCSKCSIQFRDGTLFLRHLKTHHTESKEIIRCPLCYKAYTYVAHLMHHVTKHLKGPQFKCNACVRIFCEEIELQRHISVIHRRVHEKLICRQCGKILMDYESYEKHSQTHSSKNIYCPRCPMTFKLKLQMEKHLASQHKDDKTFVSAKQVQNVLNQEN
uniref:C2H2-type domain-containing protein n=1 Tax=Phlebotomus papatasi TaxID=29031 RepID=A0A1B0DNF9_PHLPP